MRGRLETCEEDYEQYCPHEFETWQVPWLNSPPVLEARGEWRLLTVAGSRSQA